MMIKSFLVLVLCALSVGCNYQASHPQTLILNREGNKSLKAQNAQEASEKYLAALRYDPYQPELHLNLGLSFEFLQMPDKALQSYRYADELAQKENQPMVSFMARFNAGQLLGKAKKVDEALEFYQKALDILPSSIETKHNIELLTQSQQGGGQGEGENKDDKKDQPQQGDQKKDDKGQGKDQDKKEDPKDGKDKDENKKESKPQEKQQSPKYKPRPFAGKELDEGDVKKILGEIKQQEQRIRADFNRKEQKEQPRDKDW